MIRINGTETNAAGMTVAEYLEKTNYDKKRIAIEVNGNIIPKSQYESFTFSENDNIEIVSFVGGG
mgnify:CR=1 FL=1|jgi:sulfur carrier protein